jgi:hypothetical protein
MADISDIVRDAYNCTIAHKGVSLPKGLAQYDGYYLIIKNEGHLYSERSCRCTTPHVDVFKTKSLAEKEAEGKIAPGFEIKRIKPRMLAHLEDYLKQKQKDYHPTR